MKKAKLLTPFLSFLMITPTIALSACGQKSSEDETNHVTTIVEKEPEVGKQFEVKFKLDDNYSKMWVVLKSLSKLQTIVLQL